MTAYRIFCQAAFLLLALTGKAQTNGSSNLDVEQYRFSLGLTDKDNQIEGLAQIYFRVKSDCPSVAFDLAGKNDTGKGMSVTAVQLNGQNAGFIQDANQVIITGNGSISADSLYVISIRYAGIPADGLIISTNKYGHRTFFGDNWPNRAHQWLPCHDHPSDKAGVQFRVIAPDHYQVISNGIQTERTNTGNGTTLTVWTETTPIPTKVMVIGVADFATGLAGTVGCIPVSSWTFPEDRDKGFFDYAQALGILDYFQQKIGPFPFPKLANVQSKTIFGGMENAGCIFYYENSINGKRQEEALLAHEIAHQWFGNSASETDWPHLWLSEGFATYLTNCYLEAQYGTDTLKSRLVQQRSEIIAFHRKHPEKPVVDSLETNLMQLLNANSYQKGGWVLHMLRRKLGDDLFWKSIAAYYQEYALKNASTNDLMTVCERVSGLDLHRFFQQWLRQPAYPMLEISWKKPKRGPLELVIRQTQEELMDFPLEFRIETLEGGLQQTFPVKDRITRLSIPVSQTMTGIAIDPNANLLGDWLVKRVK